MLSLIAFLILAIYLSGVFGNNEINTDGRSKIYIELFY